VMVIVGGHELLRPLRGRGILLCSFRWYRSPGSLNAPANGCDPFRIGVVGSVCDPCGIGQPLAMGMERRWRSGGRGKVPGETLAREKTASGDGIADVHGFAEG